ncbi:hypothetical protein [uncultured Xylophilus sp.]|uniref:hypothetical protein n=1 Tax=uncultured Xylophilus sp. TaxID=296832 RepID=UPI0025D064AD|nr:hypothetical protein [uncultured Xylophilus sp.]
MKRTREEIYRALAAAHAERKGRLIADIDYGLEEEDLQARRAVSVRLRSFDARGERMVNEVAAAERRFRIAFERALGGPQAVLAAMHASEAARETPLEELSAAEQALLKRWAGAAGKTRAEGLEGLDPVTSSVAWFEVRLGRCEARVMAPPAAEPPRPQPPAVAPPDQGELF